MRCKLNVFVAIAALAVGGAGFGPLSVGTAYAACAPGEKIGGSTADQAKKKIEAAGFRGVRVLAKSCDNFWHGTATKNGTPVRIFVSPLGEVQVDGE